MPQRELKLTLQDISSVVLCTVGRGSTPPRVFKIRVSAGMAKAGASPLPPAIIAPIHAAPVSGIR